jgi:hypothetical protein
MQAGVAAGSPRPVDRVGGTVGALKQWPMLDVEAIGIGTPMSERAACCLPSSELDRLSTLS